MKCDLEKCLADFTILLLISFCSQNQYVWGLSENDVADKKLSQNKLTSIATSKIGKNQLSYALTTSAETSSNSGTSKILQTTHSKRDSTTVMLFPSKGYVASASSKKSSSDILGQGHSRNYTKISPSTTVTVLSISSHPIRTHRLNSLSSLSHSLRHSSASILLVPDALTSAASILRKTEIKVKIQTFSPTASISLRSYSTTHVLPSNFATVSNFMQKSTTEESMEKSSFSIPIGKKVTVFGEVNKTATKPESTNVMFRSKTARMSTKNAALTPSIRTSSSNNSKFSTKKLTVKTSTKTQSTPLLKNFSRASATTPNVNASTLMTTFVSLSNSPETMTKILSSASKSSGQEVQKPFSRSHLLNSSYLSESFSTVSNGLTSKQATPTAIVSLETFASSMLGQKSWQASSFSGKTPSIYIDMLTRIVDKSLTTKSSLISSSDRETTLTKIRNSILLTSLSIPALYATSLSQFSSVMASPVEASQSSPVFSAVISFKSTINPTTRTANIPITTTNKSSTVSPIKPNSTAIIPTIGASKVFESRGNSSYTFFSMKPSRTTILRSTVTENKSHYVEKPSSFKFLSPSRTVSYRATMTSEVSHSTSKPATFSSTKKINATTLYPRTATSKMLHPTGKPTTPVSSRKIYATSLYPTTATSKVSHPTGKPTTPVSKRKIYATSLYPTTATSKVSHPTGKPTTPVSKRKIYATSLYPTTATSKVSHPTGKPSTVVSTKETVKTTSQRSTGIPSTKRSTLPIKTTIKPVIEIPEVTTKSLASFQSAITIEFRVNFPALGNADKLQIVVQKYDSSSTGDNKKLHTWYEVHYFEEFKHHPYVAKVFASPKYTTRALFNFTIGNDKRCQKQQVSSEYCNGPLEKGTYRFRLFYHVDGEVKKSKFSKIYSTAPAKPTIPIQTTGIDQNDVTIAVIAVLAVLLVFIIIVAVILYRKKNSRREASGDSDDPDCTLLSSLKRNSSSCYGRRVLGVGDSSLSLRNVSKGMSRPVHVKDFIPWVTRSQADSDFRFAEEFESIRDVGRDQSHEASDMPENRGKNRYTNVLAHDKTRVKLSYTDDEAGSDYINANYIHGYKHPRAYIAAQGPLPGTTDDFWRMIWEQNAHIIVMVTQLTERSRVKCHEYWPGTQPTGYGEITVSLLSEFSYPDWVEREFLLEGEGEGSRKVKHLQYTAWPDHGVPRTTLNILEFLQSIRSNFLPEHGPLVIHCSAGVGRTGTLIAIDTLINRLQEEDTVDVYLTVCLMRMQRCHMVQTEDQYIFIHRAVVEYLKNQNPVLGCKGYSLLPKDDENDKSSFDHLAPTSDVLAANRDSGLALLLGEFETEHAKEAMESIA